ncbi:MAG: hypothetical protein ACP6IY_19200 [Promethearchaeia archaeon]
MPIIELNEVLNLIVMSIALGIFCLVIIKLKSFIKYLPGFITLWIAFISTNLEALFFPEMFNFIEHISILLTGILIFFAIFSDYINKYLKVKDKKERSYD